jgi:hypothetical protein
MSVMDPDDGSTQRHFYDHLPESSPPVRTDDSEEQAWGVRNKMGRFALEVGRALRRAPRGRAHAPSGFPTSRRADSRPITDAMPTPRPSTPSRGVVAGFDRVGSGRGERRCHDRLLELSIDRWVNGLTSTFRTRMTGFSRRSVESRGGSQPHEVNPQGSLNRRTSPRCVAR